MHDDRLMRSEMRALPSESRLTGLDFALVCSRVDEWFGFKPDSCRLAYLPGIWDDF